jgi:hypothetical protein
MFIALETLASPLLLNDPPFHMSPNKGGRIKHVLNVEVTLQPRWADMWWEAQARLQAGAGGGGIDDAP